MGVARSLVVGAALLAAGALAGCASDRVLEAPDGWPVADIPTPTGPATLLSGSCEATEGPNGTSGACEAAWVYSDDRAASTEVQRFGVELAEAGWTHHLDADAAAEIYFRVADGPGTNAGYVLDSVDGILSASITWGTAE